MVDPIVVQLVRGNVSSLVEEMQYHFYRSGYSTIIRESRDFSCAILDREGRLLVAPSSFFHGPVYYLLVRQVRAIYGPQGVVEGDVIVCNHPYLGNLPHVPDMAVLAPIFMEGELIGWSGSIAHKADVGGVVPGSVYGQATELFQEGLLLPPVKLYTGGEPNRDLERLIAANSRSPNLVLGDLRGQVGVVRQGIERMVQLAARYGVENLVGAFEAILRSTADELRRHLTAWISTVSEAEGFLDSDGIHQDRPVRLHVRVAVEGDTLHFDFSGSDSQTTGPVNLRPALVEACCFYAVIGCVDPSIPYNDGIRDVVKLTLAPRSVLNAEPPAPCSSYVLTCQRLVDVILQALGDLNPVRAIAHSGGSGGALTVAYRRNPRPSSPHVHYEILGSAYGAGNGYDGASGVTVHLSNILITPIEILETEFPCRVTRFELVPDSGGKGRFRGGLSFRRQYQLLEPATVVIRLDRSRFSPKGLHGGSDGRPSAFVVYPGTERERALGGSGRYELEAGDAFLVEGAGGGGFGDPADREPEAIRHDLEEGYVTRW